MGVAYERAETSKLEKKSFGTSPGLTKAKKLQKKYAGIDKHKKSGF